VPKRLESIGVGWVSGNRKIARNALLP